MASTSTTATKRGNLGTALPKPKGKKKPKMHPISLNHKQCSSNGDLVREKLERYWRRIRTEEEKPKPKPKINVAAETAPKKSTKAADFVVELKEQRLIRERKAARIALEKMENTAHLELNTDGFNELWILSGKSLSRGKTLMKKLGLFMKRQYLDEEDYDNEDEAFLHELDDDQENKAKSVLDQLQLKQYREIEIQRQASRMALEKMENTSGIEQNGEILKELWILSEGFPTPVKALNRLGLFIKHEYDYLVGDDDDEEAFLYEDIEEGEIV